MTWLVPYVDFLTLDALLAEAIVVLDFTCCLISGVRELQDLKVKSLVSELLACQLSHVAGEVDVCGLALSICEVNRLELQACLLVLVGLDDAVLCTYNLTGKCHE